jgi:hypothetical protein
MYKQSSVTILTSWAFIIMALLEYFEVVSSSALLLGGIVFIVCVLLVGTSKLPDDPVRDKSYLHFLIFAYILSSLLPIVMGDSINSTSVLIDIAIDIVLAHIVYYFLWEDIPKELPTNKSS